MRFTSGWMSEPCPQNLLGYSFIIKGNLERRRRTSLSFLHKCHVSIISFSSRLNKGVFLSLYGQASPTNIVSYVCREHVLTYELTGQDVGFMPPLFYCLGA